MKRMLDFQIKSFSLIIMGIFTAIFIKLEDKNYE